MTQKQFLKRNARGTETQRSRAESADGTRRDFEDPRAGVVDAKFCVNRPVREAEGANGGRGAIAKPGLLRCGESRRRDVDCFLEIGAFERIGLVEEGENAETAAVEESFDGDFPARNVTFDEELIERRLARRLDFRRGKKRANARDGGAKFLRVIGADDALAGGERKRFYDAGEIHARESFFEGFGGGESEKFRDRNASGAKSFALRELVAAAEDGFGIISREAEGACGESCGWSGAVAESENRGRGIFFVTPQDFVRGGLRVLEMQGERAIAPGIFELVAAIGGEFNFDAERLGGVGEALRLIAELAGEEEKFLGRRDGHSVRMRQTNASAWRKDFLASAMGANWSPVGSAQQYQGSVR